MTDPDPRLDDLLLDWEERYDRGEDVPVAQLCPDQPELAERLAERIAALKRVAWVNRTSVSAATPDETSNRLAFASGAVVGGRYRLDERIAEGGQGQVWRGHDLKLQRAVAVKVPQVGRTSGGLLDEARKVARLRHPGIVPVFDVVAHAGAQAVVSELVVGSDLGQRLAGGPLPVREAVGVVARVAEALHHAHEEGFVHRDVKPANILLDSSGRPALTDFGIAADIDSPTDGSGTLAYMAPEQLFGEPSRVDRRTDVYALGLVLYQALTGQQVFTATAPAELRAEILSTEPVLPRHRNRRVPKAVERVCLRCLAKSPANRFQTAQAVADELNAWLGRRRTSRGLVAGAVATASLAVVLGGLVPARQAIIPPSMSQPSAPPVFGREVALFGGPTLTGWQSGPDGTPPPADAFTLANGLLVVRGPKNVRAYTQTQFRDFLLLVEYRVPPGGDDGGAGGCLLLRVASPTRKANRQLRVKLGAKGPGQVLTTDGDVKPSDQPSPLRAVGEWNRLRVRCIGSQVESDLNGRISFHADAPVQGGSIGFWSQGCDFEIRRLSVQEVLP